MSKMVYPTGDMHRIGQQIMKDTQVLSGDTHTSWTRVCLAYNELPPELQRHMHLFLTTSERSLISQLVQRHHIGKALVEAATLAEAVETAIKQSF